jgi:hypothetical protein
MFTTPVLVSGERASIGGKIEGRIDAIDFPFEFLIEAVHRPIRSSWHVDASVGASRGARYTTRVRSVTRLRNAAGARSDDDFRKHDNTLLGQAARQQTHCDKKRKRDQAQQNCACPA